MKKSLLLAAALIVAAFVGGCGGGPAGSCSTSASGQCIDYGTGFTSADVMRTCTGGATYSATACTTTGRVGRCVITATSGGATASSTLNFYAPITADIGMMACTAAGMGGATAVYMAN